MFLKINKNQKDLVKALVNEKIIRRGEVARVMEQVDRQYFAPHSPY